MVRKKSHNLINDAKRRGVRIDWTDMRASEDFTVLQGWVSNSYILKSLRISVLTIFLPIIPTHCPGSFFFFFGDNRTPLDDYICQPPLQLHLTVFSKVLCKQIKV